MKRTIAGVLALAGMLLTTACGPENTDPRVGKVTIESSDCLFGDCYEIYKVCQGPDLVFVNTQLDDENRERRVDNSAECGEFPTQDGE